MLFISFKKFLLFFILSVGATKTATAKTPFTIEAADSTEKQYNIAERGAIGDGKTLKSKAIQAAIDACAQNGGGTVVIPKGIFLSGALFLKPGVNLKLQEGAPC